MRKDITVTALPRNTRGKNEARRLRVAKLSPAVVYGIGKEPLPVSVSPKEIERILHSRSGHNTVFNLDIQGETTPVMIVDTQRDPIKDRLLHADFLRIDLSKPLKAKIPVHFQGEPKGVKIQGGSLEVVTREIEVEVLPEDILDEMVENIAELMVGQSLRASEVKLPGSMKLVSKPDLVLVHVVGHKAEEAAPAEVVAVPAGPEPEVIKKGKKEEAGAPAAGGEKKAPAGDKAKKK